MNFKVIFYQSAAQLLPLNDFEGYYGNSIDQLIIIIFIYFYLSQTRNSSWDENTRTWGDYIVLFTYLRLSTDIHWTGTVPLGINRSYLSYLFQLKTFELKLHFVEYVQHMCGLRLFAGPPIYHLQGNVISVTVALVYYYYYYFICFRHIGP